MTADRDVRTSPSSSAGPSSGAGAAGSVAAPRPSLLRAELRRLRSRRFVVVLVALALAGYVVFVGVASVVSFGKATPERLRQAEAAQAAAVEESEGFRQQCLESEDLPDDVPPEDFCGPPVTAENVPVSQFLDKEPFEVEEYVPAGAVAVGVATSALAFLVGATFVGAEWSSRSMVALLFWEPRRVRVMGAKLGVLVAATAALSVVAQLLWWGTGSLMGRFLGTTGPLPDGWLGDLFAVQARVGVLVVLAGLLGFAISNLARGTGAALGVGFVYFAVVETAVRAVRPSAQEYLLTDSAAALVLEGGHRVFLFDGETGTTREILVSNLQGGLVLGLATAALLAVGIVLFARRDLH